MSMELSGKVSIITGASSGLGQATAVMFARRGAMITLCGRDQDRLKAVLDQCTQASGGHQERFITVQGDVTEASVRQEIVDKTIQTFGRLNVLFANAGIAAVKTNIREATEEIFDRLFNFNVKSAFFLIQTALPHLEASKGNIICTSSMLSSTPCSPALIYPMTKAALDHMTRCLALHLGAKGIRVNAVNPSYIPTRIDRDLAQVQGQLSHVFLNGEKSLQPLEGQLGTSEDVANAVCYLASDAAKFTTGQCLLVDGGRSLTGPFGPSFHKL